MAAGAMVQHLQFFKAFPHQRNLTRSSPSIPKGAVGSENRGALRVNSRELFAATTKGPVARILLYRRQFKEPHVLYGPPYLATSVMLNNNVPIETASSLMGQISVK